MECCGKMICSGCSYAPVYDNQGNKIAEKVCAFCRTPTPDSEEEAIERLRKRVEADAFAMQKIGFYYFSGTYGYPRDNAKAVALYHRAGELGNTWAYLGIANAYFKGEGVEMNKRRQYITTS